jgi:hypothetical protein
MYDTLIFLHVLSAFAVFVTVATYSALALGGSADRPTVTLANVCWDVGGLGLFALGIWLALYVDGYQIWDGWILGALVLFAVATELGRRARVGFEAEDAASAEARQAAAMHWLRTAVVVGILVLMIYKPGA